MLYTFEFVDSLGSFSHCGYWNKALYMVRCFWLEVGETVWWELDLSALQFINASHLF